MTTSEIVAIALPLLYGLATAVAAKCPNTKLGTVCAIVALATKHDVTPKAK